MAGGAGDMNRPSAGGRLLGAHRPAGGSLRGASPVGSATARFRNLLPKKPYCSDDLSQGLKIRGVAIAVGMRYIQFDGPGMVNSLVFDVDRWGAGVAAEEVGLPTPNLAVVNPANGHAHLSYFLRYGVCKTPKGRMGPLRYLAAIERAFIDRLDADRGYAGLVTKNPLHASWITRVVHTHEYEMAELSDDIDLSAHKEGGRGSKRLVVSGLGRNCSMFDVVRFWAYESISQYWGPGQYDSWCRAVLHECQLVNGGFQVPLPFSEVKATSRSIAKWWCPSGRDA